MKYLIYLGERYPLTYRGNRADKKLARAYIRRVKLMSRCIKCGESRPWCIQYHHRDKTKKFMGITTMASRGFPIDLIKREMNKCDCLCANDHQEFHYRHFWIKP